LIGGFLVRFRTRGDIKVGNLQIWLKRILGYEGHIKPEELSYQALVDLLCDLLFCGEPRSHYIEFITKILEEDSNLRYGTIVRLANHKNSCELSREWARRVLKKAAQNEKHHWNKGARTTLARLGVEV